MPVSPSAGPLHIPGTTIIPAATLVVLRKPANSAPDGPPQMLMVERSRTMQFAGGAVVFPGGRVDPTDHALAQRILPDDEPELGAARIAAIRETLEETGLLVATTASVPAVQVAQARAMLFECGALSPVLDHFGWHLDPLRLTLFAHWVRPAGRRFDTRFFVTDLGTGAVETTVDETENTRLFWDSAHGFLRQIKGGTMHAIFPTLCNLARLAQWNSPETMQADIAAHPVQRIHSSVEKYGERKMLTIPQGLGYPLTQLPLDQAYRD